MTFRFFLLFASPPVLILPFFLPSVLLVLFLLSPFSSAQSQPLPSYLPSLESLEESEHASFGQTFSTEQPSSEKKKEVSKTEVTCQKEATFNNKTNIGEFFGKVSVKNTQFDLYCDHLIITLREDHRGMKQGEAIGHVVITQDNIDSEGNLVHSVGHAGRAHYNPATGDVTLTDWPQLQQGVNNHIAIHKNTKMILNKDGRSTTIGQSKTVIVDTQKVTSPK